MFKKNKKYPYILGFLMAFISANVYAAAERSHTESVLEHLQAARSSVIGQGKPTVTLPENAPIPQLNLFEKDNSIIIVPLFSRPFFDTKTAAIKPFEGDIEQSYQTFSDTCLPQIQVYLNQQGYWKNIIAHQTPSFTKEEASEKSWQDCLPGFLFSLYPEAAAPPVIFAGAGDAALAAMYLAAKLQHLLDQEKPAIIATSDLNYDKKPKEEACQEVTKEGGYQYGFFDYLWKGNPPPPALTSPAIHRRRKIKVVLFSPSYLGSPKLLESIHALILPEDIMILERGPLCHLSTPSHAGATIQVLPWQDIRTFYVLSKGVALVMGLYQIYRLYQLVSKPHQEKSVEKKVKTKRRSTTSTCNKQAYLRYAYLLGAIFSYQLIGYFTTPYVLSESTLSSRFEQYTRWFSKAYQYNVHERYEHIAGIPLRDALFYKGRVEAIYEECYFSKMLAFVGGYS